MTFRRLPLSPEPHLPEHHPFRFGLCWGAGADVDVQHTFSLEEQRSRSVHGGLPRGGDAWLGFGKWVEV